MRAAALLVVALAACDDGPPPLADCAGPLGGVWHVQGDPLVFHAILTPKSYELLPIVDDGHVDGRRVVAPGAIELPRERGETADGTYARRYEQDGAICVVKTPVRLHTCAGQTIHLDVAPPQPPTDLATCTAPASPTVTWTLTRTR